MVWWLQLYCTRKGYRGDSRTAGGGGGGEGGGEGCTSAKANQVISHRSVQKRNVEGTAGLLWGGKGRGESAVLLN